MTDSGRRAPRVGLFGLLGSGNIGNDASLESVLRYLNTRHPDAVIDAMCMGPDSVTAKFGIAAIPLQWARNHGQRAPRPVAIAAKVAGKGIDVFRTAAWVRRHDAVIVPGMGVLEATLPLRPFGVPYAMFLLCASGRLFRTRVALVSVGANNINQPLTRLFFDWAARLAFYRSYRDVASRDAMRKRGIDTSRDRVYPDLVFGLPAPAAEPGDRGIVGLGVMAYYGTNDDRRRADDIHSAYVASINAFIRWLVDDGRTVRLFVGDTCDDSMVEEILADLRANRPGLEPDRVVAEPITSYADLTRAMIPAGTVIATRYHNVMCALRLVKPTISIGYALKNIALMTDAGLGEFCQFANELDVDKLIAQFTKLEDNSAELRHAIAKLNAANAQSLDQQFAELSGLLLPAGEPTHVDG